MIVLIVFGSIDRCLSSISTSILSRILLLHRIVRSIINVILSTKLLKETSFIIGCRLRLSRLA